MFSSNPVLWNEKCDADWIDELTYLEAIQLYIAEGLLNLEGDDYPELAPDEPKDPGEWTIIVHSNRQEDLLETVLIMLSDDSWPYWLIFHIDYSDESSRCYECGRYVRTEPTGFWWKPEYLFAEGDLLCFPCFTDWSGFTEKEIEQLGWEGQWLDQDAIWAEQIRKDELGDQYQPTAKETT